jgi:hypothetical protein
VIWTELLELLGGVSLDELDELETAGALDELDAIPVELDDSCAGQFPPMQNVSVSPGVPMSVIFSPVLEPLYQRMAG